MSFFVSVAVEKTSFCFDKLFSYEVSDELVSRLKLGCFVAVPFGKSNELRQGLVVGFLKEAELGCKMVAEVLSCNSAISVELLRVAAFLHETCFCTWFNALRAVLPSGLFFKKQTLWHFELVNETGLNESQLRLARSLQNFKSTMSKNELSRTICKLASEKNSKAAIRSFKKMGLIFKSEVFKRRVGSKRLEKVVASGLKASSLKLTKKQNELFGFIEEFGPINSKEACYRTGVSAFVLKKLEQFKLIEFVGDEEGCCSAETKEPEKERFKEQTVVLTAEQEKAAAGLIELLENNKACTALLRGVTGSGKTQVFLQVLDFVIKKGKQVILLVPEIVLTSQIVRFFKAKFGKIVAVLNSSLTAAQQLNEHEKIKQGAAKLIIGTRSAVFAPCENLGLIIIDEEGETTYKNSETEPRYHARDVAKFRCSEFGALLILASATPSIETQFFAKTGRYFEFVLNRRFGKAVLPEVFVVDLNKAKASPIEGISSSLYYELVKNLERKEQSIVLLNRRGHNSSVVCLNCGFKASCKNCSAVLTYHSVNKSLICHYCGHIRPAISFCEKCSSSRIIYFGQGTQKIEQEFEEKFFNAKILRLDSDSVFDRANLIKKIEDFEQGKYDVLIGTQIVAKGLNFFNVTLVGVVAIDNMLYGSDFRSGEQMFSLLTQVVGRSGRGNKKGRALIQTHNPHNSIILKAASQNYESFYDEEILERKQFLSPPFCDLCVVNFSSSSCEKVKICAKSFVSECKNSAIANVPIKVLGIATPFIEKLNNRYRNRVIIKCRNSVSFRNWIRKVAGKVFVLKKFSGVRVNIDMNGEIL